MLVDPERLLDGLDPEQARAVTTTASPLCILAPAGSGKTRVLTRRIAHRIATGETDPSHILALTFTRKAAGELRDRLRRLGARDGVLAGTFHSVAYAQLRSRWADHRKPPPTLLDRKSKLLGPLLPAELRRDRSRIAGEVASEIEWAKARMVGPDAYPSAVVALGRTPPLSTEVVAASYQAYERAKADAGLIDFDDLLGLCIAALEADKPFAAAQRWRFRHLFVDELQDVNPLQFRLLEAWRDGRDDACAVGDPQQSIYGWNGADPRFLLDIAQHWRGVEVIELQRSYRSTPEILAAAAAVLRQGRQPVRPIVAARQPGPSVHLSGHDDGRAEAVAVANAVRLAHRPGRPWSDQAILVRTHSQTALLAEALRDANIPHRVRGGALLERPSVRRIVHGMRSARAPLHVVIADLEAELAHRRGLANDEPTALDEPAAEATMERGDDDLTALDQVIDLGHDFLRLDPGGRVPAFLSWLSATVQREGSDAGGDAIVLSTFHSAKGLEWPVVHVAGVEDGFVPVGHARTSAARAEEARLLYVAMTRASEQLCLTWAAQRAFGGKLVDRRLSRLIDPAQFTASADELRATVPNPPEPGQDASWRAWLAEQRASLAAARGPDAPRLEALHRWRDTAARAARIEPSALVRDEVLAHIVRTRPTDVGALGRIDGVGPLLATRFGDAMLAALGGES